MRALLEEWKQHQRSGARLDRETETALWQRFSPPATFDKARRVHFAQLESSQSGPRQPEEALVAEAEGTLEQHRLSATPGPFKRL